MHQSLLARKYNKKKTFPLVLVQVRQQGAWKLHPYNSIAKNCQLLAILALIQNFEVHAVSILAHNLQVSFIHSPITKGSYTKPYLYSQALAQHLRRHLFFPWQVTHYKKGKHINYYQNVNLSHKPIYDKCLGMYLA